MRWATRSRTSSTSSPGWERSTCCTRCRPGAGLIEYELHDPVIAEYLQLLSEPAYLDDVAIVTPVERSFRESMYRTRGDRPEDFPARVESSISFLRFLRDSEDRFRDPDQLRPGVDHDAFREALYQEPPALPVAHDGHRVSPKTDRLAKQRLLEDGRRHLVEQAALRPRPGRGRDNAGNAGANLTTA